MRFLAVVLAVIVAMPSLGIYHHAMAQTDAAEQLGGAEADVNCPQLLSQADAQILFDTTIELDGEDVYELDGTPEDDEACNGEQTELNTEPLASCANLRLPEHAEALYVAGGPNDPYNLDPNGNDIPCDSEEAAEEPLEETPLDPEPIPSDLPTDLPAEPDPAEAEAPDDCDVAVRAGRAYVFTDCADGSVQAGFEPFEGFDGFAERAQNGFGAFDDTDDAGTTSVDVTQEAVPVNGSTGGTTSGESASGETRLAEGEQQARGGKAKQAKKKARQAAKKRKAQRQRQQRSTAGD